jgi:hypothetical protein
MHHLRMSIYRGVLESDPDLPVKAGFQVGRKSNIKHTLRLEELQLTVEELEMGLGEDDLRNIVVTGATTAHIARLSHGIPGVDAILQVGGIVLGRHCVNIGGICMICKDGKAGLKAR